jgi:hypothetical protein
MYFEAPFPWVTAKGAYRTRIDYARFARSGEGLVADVEDGGYGAMLDLLREARNVQSADVRIAKESEARLKPRFDALRDAGIPVRLSYLPE